MNTRDAVSLTRSLKGSAASIFLYLLFTRATATKKQLVLATGYTDKPIASGLALLEMQKLVQNNGNQGWSLSTGIDQLPLPNLTIDAPSRNISAPSRNISDSTRNISDSVQEQLFVVVVDENNNKKTLIEQQQQTNKKKPANQKDAQAVARILDIWGIVNPGKSKIQRERPTAVNLVATYLHYHSQTSIRSPTGLLIRNSANIPHPPAEAQELVELWLEISDDDQEELLRNARAGWPNHSLADTYSTTPPAIDLIKKLVKAEKKEELENVGSWFNHRLSA